VLPVNADTTEAANGSESRTKDLLCADGKKHWWANMSRSEEKGIRDQRCDLCGKWRKVKIAIDDKST